MPKTSVKAPAHNSLAALPWPTVDWSRPNTEIAATLGCSHSTVGQYRRLHAPETLPLSPAWHTVTGWAEKSNAAIATELGVPLATVSDYRRKRKLPHGPRSPGTGLHRRTGQRKPAPLTLHDKGRRLDAVWAYLWPDDPMNLRRLNEVTEIQQRTKP